MQKVTAVKKKHLTHFESNKIIKNMTFPLKNTLLGKLKQMALIFI